MIHLLKIDSVEHVDNDGSTLWHAEHMPNTFHLSGELFLLSVAFNTSSGITVPTSYYLGLDNRASIQVSDTLTSLSAEPTQNGYLRQAVSSLNGFSVGVSSGNYRAVSSIVTFSASGGNWGPVSNLFLATTSTTSGYLLSSVSLDNSITVLNGQSLTLRISVGLTN